MSEALDVEMENEETSVANAKSSKVSRSSAFALSELQYRGPIGQGLRGG